MTLHSQTCRYQSDPRKFVYGRFLYSSDDSRLHSHSQQTSEESARYEDHSGSNPFKSPPSPISAPLPSTLCAPTSQTVGSPSQPDKLTRITNTGAENSDDGYTYHLYPLQGDRSSSEQDYGSRQPASGISPHLGAHDGGQGADGPNTEQSHPARIQQQQRRAGHHYSSAANEASNHPIPSTSNHHQQQRQSSSHVSSTGFEAPHLASASSRGRDASMYHTREDSSFSSSASDSVELDPLLRQDKHNDGRPKRPLNAFMIYSRSRRGTLLQERPELKATEIAGVMAEEWRSLETVSL